MASCSAVSAKNSADSETFAPPPQVLTLIPKTWSDGRGTDLGAPVFFGRLGGALRVEGRRSDLGYKLANSE